MRPNIFLGVSEGSAQYRKWYFELVIDHVDHFLTAEPSHLRVGWASTKGYAPYPGGGEGWGGNGVGDDLYSYGFDGLHLWSGTIALRSLRRQLTTEAASLLKLFLMSESSEAPYVGSSSLCQTNSAVHLKT